MTGTYDKWNTPALWEMVAHESAEEAAKQLDAWDQKIALLDDQAKMLGNLRDQLAQHWDPAGSPAAQAFIDRVDQMLETVQATSKAARRVWLSYAQVSESIQSARKKLQPLHDAYDDHRAARDSEPWYAQIWNTDSPAVMAHYQGQVDQRARAIMEEMDQQIAEATADPAAIQPPDRYAMGDSSSVTNSGGDGGSSSSTTSVVQPPFNPPPPSIASTPPGTADGAPILAGTPTATMPATFPVPPTSPSVISAPMPVAAPILLPPRPVAGIVPPAESLLRQNPPRFGGVIGEPESRPLSSMRRPAVPTDGVIRGGPVPSAVERTGPPMTSGSMSSSGSIRGRQPLRRASQTMSGDETRANVVSRSRNASDWRDLSYEAYTKRHPSRKDDPDNPWSVEEGVAPVLEAPSDPDDHSATPGVIGIDR